MKQSLPLPQRLQISYWPLLVKHCSARRIDLVNIHYNSILHRNNNNNNHHSKARVNKKNHILRSLSNTSFQPIPFFWKTNFMDDLQNWVETAERNHIITQKGTVGLGLWQLYTSQRRFWWTQMKKIMQNFRRDIGGIKERVTQTQTFTPPPDQRIHSKTHVSVIYSVNAKVRFSLVEDEPLVAHTIQPVRGHLLPEVCACQKPFFLTSLDNLHLFEIFHPSN